MPRLAKSLPILLAIIGFGVLLRAFALTSYGTERLAFGDAQDYLTTARVICAGQPYPERGALPFFRAPGFPFFLAGATLCDLESAARAKVMVLLADGLTIGLIGLLAGYLWRSSAAALIAAGLAALHPFFIVQSVDLRSEPVFTMLLLMAILGLLATRRNYGGTWPVATGALLALAALVRPVALALLPVFTLASIKRGPGSHSKLNGVPAVWLAIGFLMMLAPWMLYTQARFGELIIVNDAGGYNLWRASTPEMRKLSTIRDRTEFAAAANRFELEISPRMAARIETEGTSPLTRNRLWMEQAGREFQEAPGEWIRYSLQRAASYWRPWLNPAVHSNGRVILSGLWNILVFIGAGYGLLRLFRTRRDIALILIGILAVTWVAHIPFQVVMRMRIAFTDPIFLALAAAPLESLGKEVLRRALPATFTR